MAEIKTKVNTESVVKFLRSIKDKEKRDDCTQIAAMMEQATNSKPEMWGAAIVGFGRRKVVYANGKEAEWMQMASLLVNRTSRSMDSKFSP